MRWQPPACLGSTQAVQTLGIGTALGVLFSADARFANHLRLNLGHPGDERIDRALRQLGELAAHSQPMPRLEWAHRAMERMRVEQPSPSQHESLVDLLCELHAYYNAGASVPRELVRSYLVEHLLAADSPLRLVVAFPEDGPVIGFAAIALTWSLVDPTPEKRRHCWLKELYVRSSKRGLGAGRALMSWVARHAVENGCGRIDWPVKAGNDRGIAFYEGLGAEQVADRLSYRLCEPSLSKLAGERTGANGAARMNALSTIRRIDYTVIYTSDMPAMRHFYEAILGFTLLRELSARWIEYQVGSNILALSARGGRFDDRPPPAGALSLQLAFRVAPKLVDACAEELVAAGVRLIGPPTDQPFGHRTVFFRDPDGNVLEIYAEI